MERKVNFKIILRVSLLLILVSCNMNKRYNGDTYRIQENGLYGYIDSLGQEIIKPQYLYAEYFSEDGVALVVLDTVHTTQIDTLRTRLLGNKEYQNIMKIKYGYINKANKSIFSQPSTAIINIPSYSSFYNEFIDFCSNRSFNGGLAVVSDSITHKYGYINLQGDTVIPCIYNKAGRFSEDLAVVQKTYNPKIKGEERGKYGFINREGKETSDFKFDQLDRCLNGRSIGTIHYVHHEKQVQEIDGVIRKDKNGRTYVDKSKRSVRKVDRDENYSYEFKRFLVDGRGHIIGNQLPPTYYYFNFSKDGFAAAVPNDIGTFFNLGCKFLKNNGEFLSPLEGVTDSNIDYITKEQKSNVHLPEDIKILNITRFTNGYAAVQIDNNAWIYVDKYLLVHSPLRDNQVLENAGPFSYGLAPVKINGKWGYINTDFDLVIPCTYDSCSIAERKLCKVYQSNYDLQIISYIDRHENIVWQQTIHNSGLDRSSNNSLQWRRDLESSDNYNKWSVVIIICVLSTLLFFIVENFNKLTKIFFPKKTNNTNQLDVLQESIYRCAKEKVTEKGQQIFSEKNNLKEDLNKSNSLVSNSTNIRKKNISDSPRRSCKSSEKPNLSSEKSLTHISQPKEQTIKVKTTSIKREIEKPAVKVVENTTSTNMDLSNVDKPLRVLYYANNKNKTNEYAIISFPEYNCIVFPYRTHQINRRGYCEESFENLLNKYSTDKVHVIGNANIVLANGVRPYEPDIAIICESEKNIYIDIEIDEPYSGLTHEPIHFIGCGDNFRDINLTNAGWIVIRFAEKQIYNEPLSCISLIYKIINELDDTIKVPEELKPLHAPSSAMRWTELEAKLMALRNEREKYLHHTFGVDESEEYSPEDVTQTQRERELSALLDKLAVLEGQKPRNLDNSNKSFKQDNEIKFFAKEHIYVYKDYLELTPVSEIVGNFFNKFDDLKWSEIKARDNGVSQRYMLELWDSKGAESREVGTFLHTQIESYFNQKDITDSYHFKYDGIEIKRDEYVSIKTEWSYFIQFLKEKNITPFRTEWKIFDLKYKIAGTIDLLCKNEDCFDIYDWKRSDKINLEQTVWQYGINGLEHIPDTRYYRYCLQQNLYRYMLEENYKIKINKMYLIILHPSYQKYRQVEIPIMEKEIKIILSMFDNKR